MSSNFDAIVKVAVAGEIEMEVLDFLFLVFRELLQKFHHILFNICRAIDHFNIKAMQPEYALQFFPIFFHRRKISVTFVQGVHHQHRQQQIGLLHISPPDFDTVHLFKDFPQLMNNSPLPGLVLKEGVSAMAWEITYISYHIRHYILGN